jgi:hypothetical protein
MLEIVIVLLGVTAVFAYLFSKTIDFAEKNLQSTLEESSIADVFNKSSSLILGLLFFALTLLTAYSALNFALLETLQPTIITTTTVNNYTNLTSVSPYINQTNERESAPVAGVIDRNRSYVYTNYTSNIPFLINSTTTTNSTGTRSMQLAMEGYFQTYTWAFLGIVFLVLIFFFLSWLRKSSEANRRREEGGGIDIPQ